MAGVWLRFRTDARARWRAWLGLALLIGFASGAVLALWAGARRTDTAYDRLLDSHRAYDVAVLVPAGEPALAAFDTDQLAALPEVSEATTAGFFFAGDFVALADRNGRLGTEINRFKLLDGRAADPYDPDEAVIGFEAARAADLGVGDEITIADPEELANEPPPDPGDPVAAAFDAQERALLRILPDGKVTIVGIEASPGEFPPPATLGLGDIVYLTPAFARAVSGNPETALIDTTMLFARLKHGDADNAAFEAELEQLAGGKPFQLLRQADNAKNVRRTFHTQAVALQILAVLTAITTVLIVGQLLARSAWLESADFPTLGALGFERGQRLMLGFGKALAVGVTAAVLAVALALAASPVLPTGIAAKAEPAPGFHADGFVAAIGLGGTAFVVVVLGFVAAALAARVDARAGRRRPSSRLARSLARGGAPPTAVTGVRMALEPGSGRSSVPVRGSIACVTLGVTTIVAALGFGSSLSHLLGTPRLYGVAWDLQFTVFDDNPTDEAIPARQIREAADGFLAADGVTGASLGYAGVPLELDGVRADAVAFDRLAGASLIPALEGRAPTTAEEVMLGTRTLDELGLDIGDRVDASSQGSESRSLRIVGRGVMPPSSDTSRLGEGSFVTLAAGDALIPLIADVEAPSLFLTLNENVDGHALATQVADELGIGSWDAVPGRGAPADLVNFDRVERMPQLLGLVLAVFATAALAHLLASSVRRRRRDLALLRTIGFLRRQVRLTVMWQATTLTAVSIVVGIPLGVALGRFVWTRFASDLGVVVETRLPAAAIVLVVVGAFVVANLVAAVPAWLAARTRPAVALRSE
jgi:putative ABC transport system permease protein